MRAEPVPAKVLGHPCHNAGNWQARCVCSNDGAGRAVLLRLRQQCALDLQILRHRLDDPVALGDPLQVIVEVARRDQPRRIHRVERRRLGLLQTVQRGQRKLVPCRRTGICGRSRRHHVQQHYGHSGVGDMRGDARAHCPRAQHRDFAYLFHWRRRSCRRAGCGTCRPDPVVRDAASSAFMGVAPQRAKTVRRMKTMERPCLRQVELTGRTSAR